MWASISIYSLLFAVLVSEILLFCMIFFCKSCKNMGKGDLITATIIGLFCFCRILLPIDLRPSYAFTFNGLYADLCSLMMKNMIFRGREYELWYSVVLGIEIIALIKIIKFLLEYRSTVYYITNMEKYSVEVLENVFPKKLLHKYDIRMSNTIKIPCGIGIFHKYIILPYQTYSENELRYILMHEMQHFKEGDLLIKFMTEIICCVLWWNPLFRRIQDLISRAIEVRCDIHVTNLLSTEEKRRYMMVLIHATQSQKNMKLMTMTSLGETSSERLRERISILCDRTEKKRNKQKLIAIIAVVIFFLSYSILPVSQYSAPMCEIEVNGAQYLDLNNYMLVYKNGKYKLLDENGDFICEYNENSDTVKKLQFLMKNEG